MQRGVPSTARPSRGGARAVMGGRRPPCRPRLATREDDAQAWRGGSGYSVAPTPVQARSRRRARVVSILILGIVRAAQGRVVRVERGQRGWRGRQDMARKVKDPDLCEKAKSRVVGLWMKRPLSNHVSLNYVSGISMRTASLQIEAHRRSRNHLVSLFHPHGCCTKSLC